ncbi:MAG: metallophosphoesterase [Chloroflexi bacterium]|nr:metallophosphoesterase [Chloroflexota bacterium]
MVDLLVIDDVDAWQGIVLETFNGIYECDIASTYENAVAKIHGHNYKAICMNLKFFSLHNGRKLLTLLRDSFAEVPVILISGYFAGSMSKLQDRYPNIREIISKGSEEQHEESMKEFVKDLLETTSCLISSIGGPAPLPVTGTKPGILSWLHLSDLHIGCKERGQDWEALRDALLRDIEEHRKPASDQSDRLAGVVFEPDLIFVTGDIAFRAREEEYQKAESLLKSIWDITGLGKDHTFAVPGNHDVDREAVTNSKLYVLAYKEYAGQKTAGERKGWLEGISELWQDNGFLGFIRDKFTRYMHFAVQCTAAPTGTYYVRSVPLSGANAEIVGLNSALMSWKDGEDTERGLWIGEPQFNEVKETMSQDASLRIALVHHPREALHEHDAVWTWDRVEKQCHILLHGHLHEPGVVCKHDPEHVHLCVSGGSVHEDGIWRRQHYSYGRLNLETGELDLYLRMTKPETPDPIYVRDILTYPEAGASGCVSLNIYPQPPQ